MKLQPKTVVLGLICLALACILIFSLKSENEHYTSGTHLKTINTENAPSVDTGILKMDELISFRAITSVSCSACHGARLNDSAPSDLISASSHDIPVTEIEGEAIFTDSDAEKRISNITSFVKVSLPSSEGA